MYTNPFLKIMCIYVWSTWMQAYFWLVQCWVRHRVVFILLSCIYEDVCLWKVNQYYRKKINGNQAMKFGQLIKYNVKNVQNSIKYSMQYSINALILPHVIPSLFASTRFCGKYSVHILWNSCYIIRLLRYQNNEINFTLLKPSFYKSFLCFF